MAKTPATRFEKLRVQSANGVELSEYLCCNGFNVGMDLFYVRVCLRRFQKLELFYIRALRGRPSEAGTILCTVCLGRSQKLELVDVRALGGGLSEAELFDVRVCLRRFEKLELFYVRALRGDPSGAGTSIVELALSEYLCRNNLKGEERRRTEERGEERKGGEARR